MFSDFGVNFQDLASLWLVIMAVVAMCCFLVSAFTRNYSQVDKMWSLMPIVYSMITLASSPSPRVWMMASLVTVWGLRLSYNFYRKGGYHIIPWKGAEDYRWQVVRKHPMLKGRLRFGLFNLLFISLYQHLLILLFSTPILLASAFPDKSLTYLDYIAAFLMLAFIITESIADNQQYRFHQEKHNPGTNEGRYSSSLKQGFLTEGLWRYARHPNFASEQGIWISFYFFGVAASGQWVNFTALGGILLVLIFMGSTRLTESMSSQKYPGYAAYQQEVPKFIPRFRK